MTLIKSQVTPPRSSAQTFLRCKSNRAQDREDERESRDAGFDIYAEIEKGDMSLEQRLEHMGIDPAQYKSAKKSARKAQERFDKWIPTTKEDAQKKWKKLASTPDDITLLEMFKKEGLDVLKEGK